MKVVIMCVWMIMMIMDYESSDYVCMDVPRAQWRIVNRCGEARESLDEMPIAFWIAFLGVGDW